MLSKNTAKLIRSLHDKKHRNESGLFLVEGSKSVKELLDSDFSIESLFATENFCKENSTLIEKTKVSCNVVPQEELEKLGTLESNDSAIAIVKQKESKAFEIGEGIIIALDDIRDPGNLGTIIRIADWYGIKNIIASENTADLYNSKTISASKGSFTRVNIFYTDLEKFISAQKLPVYGAFLNGKNVHSFEFSKSGILLMGNESNGIRKEFESLVTDKITIPAYGETESLNVSIATAIIVDNWKRNIS